MKEEQGVLVESPGTDAPQEMSKGKKYVRIALNVLFVLFFMLIAGAAVYRKFWG